MLKVAVVGLLCLSACSPVNVKRQELTEPKTVVSPISRGDGFSPPDLRSVTVMLEGLKAARPEPIAFAGLDLCKAAQVVVANQLALPLACTGLGSITFMSRTDDPARLLSLFSMAVTSAGGTVGRSGSGIVVKGSNERGSNGNAVERTNSDPAPLPASLVSSVGFSLSDVPSEFFDRVSSSFLQDKAVNVRFVRGDQAAVDLQALAGALGLEVTISDFGGGAFVVGDAGDVETVISSTVLAGVVSTSIASKALDKESIEALSKVYPAVNIAYDPASEVLRVSGPSHEVSKTVIDFRRTLPAEANVKLRARFLTVSNSLFDSFNAEFGAVVGGSSGSLVLASGAYRRFSLAVDQETGGQAGSASAAADLLVSSGTTGSYKNGERVPVITGIDDEGKQSFAYIDTGVLFSASPVVDRSGLVNLGFTVSVSSADFVAGENPVISQSEVSSIVDVQAGDVVIVGGLQTISNEQKKSKSLLIFPSKSAQSSDAKTLFVIEVLKVY